MTFQPQNGLESSLVEAARDPAHRPQFYRDFIESDIFVIQHGPHFAEAKETTLGQLKIQPIQHNGKPWLPVFSSLPRLQAGIKTEVNYIALNALEFLKATKGADVILNPGSEYGKEFTHSEIAAILDGSLWKSVERRVAEKQSKVLIGQPAKYPAELVSTLSRLFAQSQQVKKAYLVHFFDPKRDEKPHTLVALEVSGDWNAVVAEAGMVAKDVEVPDPPVDFVHLTGNSGLEQYVAKDIKPFYERKLFGD